jgi:hypothetical protein
VDQEVIQVVVVQVAEAVYLNTLQQLAPQEMDRADQQAQLETGAVEAVELPAAITLLTGPVEVVVALVLSVILETRATPALLAIPHLRIAYP